MNGTDTIIDNMTADVWDTTAGLDSTTTYDDDDYYYDFEQVTTIPTGPWMMALLIGVFLASLCLLPALVSAENEVLTLLLPFVLNWWDGNKKNDDNMPRRQKYASVASTTATTEMSCKEMRDKDRDDDENPVSDCSCQEHHHDTEEEENKCSSRIKPTDCEQTITTTSEGSSASLWPDYDDCYWRELPKHARQAAQRLGYTRRIWDNNGTPPMFRTTAWQELTAEHRQCAEILGFDEESWCAEQQRVVDKREKEQFHNSTTKKDLEDPAQEEAFCDEPQSDDTCSLTMASSSSFSLENQLSISDSVSSEEGDDSNNSTTNIEFDDRSAEGTESTRSTDQEDDDDIEHFEQDGCCQQTFWCRPSILGKAFHKVSQVAKCEKESRELFRLGVPWFLLALLESAISFATISLIGMKLGTTALSIFVTVDTLLGITHGFLSGIISSLSSLCGRAAGAECYKLAGEYIQISILLYLVCAIPHAILWWFMTRESIKWFNFDDDAAQTAETYVRISLAGDFCWEIAGALHNVYYVEGYAIQSAIISTGKSIIYFAIFTFWVTQHENPELSDIAWISVFSSIVFLVCDLLFIWESGWFDDYVPGLFGAQALSNSKAIKAVLRTSLPLSIGYFLSYSEWGILVLIAGVLGPAEVAAWGTLGEIWGKLEYITQPLADAVEIRCAYWLGAGKPSQARHSVYKCLFLSISGAVLTSSALLGFQGFLSSWFTDDEVLQTLILENLPFLAIGNIVLTFGTVSYTLLGAQGRYHVSTLHVVLGSWFVTIPLAMLFAVGFNFSLEALVTAVVLGYLVSGTLNAVTLLKSDWVKLSRTAVEECEAE